MKPYKYVQLLVALVALTNGFAVASDTTFKPVEKNLNTSLIISVDPITLAGIDSVVKTYIGYLQREGYTVLLHPVAESDPAALREYLLTQYKSVEPLLTGVLFVGDFPKAFSLVEHPDYGVTPFLSMEYYQDLDGTYNHTPLSGIQWAFENHGGNVESEVWTSVIPLIGAAGSDSSLQKIGDYFQKNIDFREKRKRDVQRGHAEPIIGYSTKDVWQTQINVFVKERNFNLRSGNLTITRDNSRSDDPRFPDAKFTYEQELRGNRFDFAKVGGHGSYFYFSHVEPSISITVHWADSAAVQPLYLSDGSCNTGEFHSYEVGCVATSFLYNPNNNVVVYMAATNYSYGGYENKEGTWRNVLIDNLEKGMSFGDALLYNFRQKPVELNGRDREAYTAPRVLFGDGTLKLQEFMDYEGNDPPYILGQRQIVIPKNGSRKLTPEDVVVYDNDSQAGEMTIKPTDGMHYSIADGRIVPEGDFTGFMVIPVRCNDGKEDGQEYRLIAVVDTAEEVTVCEKGESGAVISQLSGLVPQMMQKDLPGRLYVFPEVVETVIHETFNEIRFSVTVRGPEIGEFAYQKTIIEKKEGYVGVEERKQFKGKKPVSAIIRNDILEITVAYAPTSTELFKVTLFNLQGRIVKKWMVKEHGKCCLSGIPKGAYIVELINDHNAGGTFPIMKCK